jgi:hypothetical protein
MANQAVSLTLPAIPADVLAFATERGVNGDLTAVVNLARQSFPSSALIVSLGADAEDETHQYIALDVEVGDMSPGELVSAQGIWSAGLSQVCPSSRAVYFVLGWR